MRNGRPGRDGRHRWQRQIRAWPAGEMCIWPWSQPLSAIAWPRTCPGRTCPPGRALPAGVQLALLPFVTRLCGISCTGASGGHGSAGPEGLAAMQTATPSVSPGDIVPTPQDFSTVGHLVPLDRGLASGT